METKAPSPRSELLWLALVALVLVCLGGFLTHRPWEQPIWRDDGVQKFTAFALFLLGWFACWILARPRWMPTATFLLALACTVAVAGARAPLAAGFLLFACFAVGRLLIPRLTDQEPPELGLIRMLGGLAGVMWITGLLAHFPVNYAATYLVLLGAPLVMFRRNTVEAARTVWHLFQPARWTRPETAMAALAFVPLLAHWATCLKPESSSDGLGMHLAIPVTVAWSHAWSFDAAQVIWAVMPMGGDWCYTVAYLLGGESAAHLLNLAMLLATSGLLYLSARRWVGRSTAFLLLAVYATTPLLQLLTGSMFVENFWGVMLFGGLVSLWLYRETGRKPLLAMAGALLGAALFSKIGALSFVIAASCLLIFEAVRLWRQGERKWLPLSLGLLVLAAAPPYLYAWASTGNPVFPALNAVFRSPYYETAANFKDERFMEKLSWTAPYDITFETHRYMESKDGGSGFYLLLLLPLCLLVINREWKYREWTLLAVPGAFTLATLYFEPNLRYIAPAFPFFVLLIALTLRLAPQYSPSFAKAAWITALVAAGLNMWFFPAASWYHRDFFLNPLDPSERAQFERAFPGRVLCDYLNRNHPGQPVLFLENTQLGDLRANAYSNDWHYYTFRNKLEAVNTFQDAQAFFRDIKVRFVILPTLESHIPIPEATIWYFLREFSVPRKTCGAFYVAELPESVFEAKMQDRLRQLDEEGFPADAGAYDDFDNHLHFNGKWTRDTQFPQTWQKTLTYSEEPNASFRLIFQGTEVRWVFTRAFNRGMAEVRIDGEKKDTRDLYSEKLEWQCSAIYGGLPPGRHRLEVRVTGRKNPKAAGTFVDVDELVVQ